MSALEVVHVEWLKIRRRPAFWVTLLFYFGFIVFGGFMAYREHLSHPGRGGMTLPGEWGDIAGIIAGLGGIVVTVVVILLTASEKTWRTERQNVIDGLSRDQYFLGKLFLFLAVSLIVWFGTIGIMSGYGMLDRTIAPVDAPLIDGISAKMLGGLLLRLVFLAATAFCFALITSGSGAALAFAVLFIIVQQPLMGVLTDSGGVWIEVARYMPDRVMDNLTNVNIYDADRLAAANERLRGVTERLGRITPGTLQLMSPGRALATAAVYSALFTAGGWLSIRRRDL